MKEGVARYLSTIGFEPIILHEQPNLGRTIIHKFRDVAQAAGFAVVLLSPDDETTAGQHRARQNVILELGFFLGALGPDRVAALKKGDVETPSDFDGVIYTAYEGNWKAALANELQAVGYDIDWNKVMKP
jgi:predicted nucleotide-binding protein